MKTKSSTKKKMSFIGVALATMLLASVPMNAASAASISLPGVGEKYVTDFSSHDEAVAAAKEVDLEKDEEATVLLKNKDNALPLSTKRKVTVFGSYQGSTGEAGDTGSEIASALKDEGFVVNPHVIGATTAYDIDKITKSEKQSLDVYNHVGIVTLGRYFGETCDAPTVLLPEMADVKTGALDAVEDSVYHGDPTGQTEFEHENLYSPDGETFYKHALMMTENEEKMIAYAKEHCDVVIIAWTGATTFELGLLQNDDGIDGIVWTNEWGDNGAKAFAEVLAGKINPSGKTEAIWYNDFTADPTWFNSAWQRQIFGFTGTTFGAGDFVGNEAYGYTKGDSALDAFGPDYQYVQAVEAAGKSASWYSGQIRYSDFNDSAMYVKDANGNYTTQTPTVWPAQAGPVAGLSTMFAYGMGYNYRASIQYDEGIYIGYKYYETVAADMNAVEAGSGDEWYSQNVVYPFGYGLSYTEFEWELVSSDIKAWDNAAKNSANGVYEMSAAAVKNAEITFTVKVTNTGSVAGKDVVEVYSHSPYIDGEVEKSEVNLVAFEKTKLLNPGQSDTVTLTVNMQDIASFDDYDKNDNGFSTYELDASAGYEIRFQTDSHNVKSDMKDSSGVVELPELTNDVIMGYDDFSGNAASNVLSQGNIYNSLGYDILLDNYTSGTGMGSDDDNFGTRVDAGQMTLMTRNSEKGGLTGETNAKYTVIGLEDLLRSDEWYALRNNLDAYDADFPTYSNSVTVAAIWEEWKNGSNFKGTNPVSGNGGHNIIDSLTGNAIAGFEGFHVGMWGTGVDKDASLDFNAFSSASSQATSSRTTNPDFLTMFGVDMADVDRNGNAISVTDQAKWEEFMNSLTWDEILEICSNGGSTCAVDSINKPLSQGGDSPRNWNGYNWGSMSAMAATWNKELCYKIGTIYGNLGKLNNGNNGADWWGPGGDLHRTPFCGRYNDYFSQDGYHGGWIAASIISGAESRGVSCMIKHIALNDQEAFRGGASTYATEQACRENQFKVFQIAMQEGGAKATMGSLACIGDIYANCNYAFSKLILRDEWGWNGYYATDGYGVSASYWPMDLLVRNTGWPLGADPKTTNAEQNYLSGSYHSATDGTKGVYTGYIPGTENGTDATGSKIGQTYNYSDDLYQYSTGSSATTRNNVTQWYWSRQVAEYVLYAQSTAATIRGGIDITQYGAAVNITAKQGEAITIDVSNEDFAAAAADNVKYAISDGTLPEGLVLSAAGVISGSSKESGEFSVTVQCTIDNWLTATKQVNITVASNFILDDDDNDITQATVGKAFGGYTSIIYSNGESDSNTYLYKVDGGALPAGLTLDKDTGIISGTPVIAGSYKVRIAAYTETAGGNQGVGPGASSTPTTTVYGYYDLTINVAEADVTSIQPQFKVEGGYVAYSVDGGNTWTNLISVEDLKGDSGESGNIEIRTDNGYIQYKDSNGAWQNVVALDDLKGESGGCNGSVEGAVATVTLAGIALLATGIYVIARKRKDN